MDIFIDNINLKNSGLNCLDYRGAFSYASERENQMVWANKSGVDNNLSNIRYNVNEFVLKFMVKANTLGEAEDIIQTWVDYFHTKGNVVLSLRDVEQNVRKAFLVCRSNVLIGDWYIRTNNSVFVFSMGLRDVNPAALKFYIQSSALLISINYTKGQNATLYWGDGVKEDVQNSGAYSRVIGTDEVDYDVIIDVDKDESDIIELNANFSADVVSGRKPLAVQFTDESEGNVDIYSWNFGDGFTSESTNPQHTYSEAGQYTVTLQVFNTAQGSSSEIKTNYITVSNSFLMINDTDYLLINDDGDKLRIT